jgi:hypothetical protein
MFNDLWIFAIEKERGLDECICDKLKNGIQTTFQLSIVHVIAIYNLLISQGNN